MKKKAAHEDELVPLDEPVFTSGVVCRLLSRTVYVHKQLDREGIVKPSRKPGKARLYSKNELKTLQYVWYLMEKRDVKVGGIKVILEMKSETFRME